MMGGFTHWATSRSPGRSPENCSMSQFGYMARHSRVGSAPAASVCRPGMALTGTASGTSAT